MKVAIVPRVDAAPDVLAGRVLARDVRSADGTRDFRKGHLLRDDDVPALLALGWTELHVIEPEPGDILEMEAGRRIADAAAGDGTTVGAFGGGHWPIASVRRGLLRVDVSRLTRVNAIDGACLYTLYDGQVVDAGEVVAHAKIAPFVIEESRIEMVERIAGTERAIRVAAFTPVAVAALVMETLGDRALARFRASLAEKLAWFGSRLCEPACVAPDADVIGGVMRRAVDDGAGIVVVAGTRALDPLDPMFVALDRLGVRLERLGVPAHPGSLFWLAQLHGVPVIGMPSCGLFSQATVFDLVLPRVLAGEVVGRDELSALGHGGLLSRDYAFRFPRYRESAERGALE